MTASPMRKLAAFVIFILFVTPASSSPNIVVILTDDQEDTGSMLYMPKVHALLAEHGVTFINSFSNLSLCCPSRVSFLTGQAAHNHGIRTNDWMRGGGWQAFKEKEGNALPVWLEAAGYRTALIGKYLNGYGSGDLNEADVGESRGKRKVMHPNREAAGERQHKGKHGNQSRLGSWIAWLGTYFNIYSPDTKTTEPNPVRTPPAQPVHFEPMPTWVPDGWNLWYAFAGGDGYYDYQINQNGTLSNFGREPDAYSTDVIRDRSVKFIKDQAGSADPFFMLVAPKGVHGGGGGGKGISTPALRHVGLFKHVTLPDNPAFDEEDVSDKPLAVRRTERMGAETKDKIEQAYRSHLETLQAVDDLVEAIVDALQSAGKLEDTFIIFTSDNGFAYGDHRLFGKIDVYEGSIRVPLVIRGPGIPENQTRSQLVNNLDVVATIEELAGARPGLVPDGRALTPLFADANAPWRSALLVEGGHAQSSPARRFTAVRTETRKYVKHEDGFEELYDLKADPHELENKAGDPAYASDQAALSRIYDTLKACTGSGCWVTQ
jgi:N-acetylglucosamine-6-sulfatase